MRLDLPRAGVVAAMVRRDWSITKSYELAFFLDAAFTFINLIAFFFISKTFEKGIAADLGGAPSYFAFAAVGMAMTLVVQSASVGMGTRVREEQLTGTLEMLTTQPVTATEISIGLAGFSFLFAIFRSALYILVSGLALGVDFSDANWGAFVIMMVASGVALSGIGIILGAVIMVVKRGEGIAAVATLSMGILGGALFPVEVLPGWAQGIASVMPTRYSFDGVRTAVFVGSGWGDDLLALAVFTALVMPLGLWVFRAGLAHAKRVGSLSDY